MSTPAYRFGNFVVDPVDRRLLADGEPVELNARYFDALLLLVGESGRLVSKDRFMAAVWHGIPVTDEALTQCIRTLRRALGDSAANPTFIETVPKHGYRFIAAAEALAGDARDASPIAAAPLPAATAPIAALPAPGHDWRRALLLGGAATSGAGVAGLVGGLLLGFAGAAQPAQPGAGALSVLLVLVSLSLVVALMGGAGVGFGIAAAGLGSPRPWQWSIVGGGAGGLAVGAIVKLLGLDAFNLLLGQTPGDITGAGEGLLLGAAVGFAVWSGGQRHGTYLPRRSIGVAALASGGAGVVIAALGGRLMAGSLDLLARSFPHSRLRIDPIGGLFGEAGFGPISQIAVAGLEGSLFGACLVGAMALAQRRLDRGAG